MISMAELKRRKAKLDQDRTKNKVIEVAMYLTVVTGVVVGGWLSMVMAIIIGG